MSTQDADKQATVNIANAVITGVTPDPIRMGTGPNRHIIWSIASADQNAANYSFPDDGIALKADPDGQFTKLGPQANGKKFRMHNKNSDITRYQYTVRIMNGTTALAPLDPAIDNGT